MSMYIYNKLQTFYFYPGQSIKSQQESPGNTGSISMLEKLMNPVVNIRKLPSTITPNVVVMVSDDEGEGGSSLEGGASQEGGARGAGPRFSLAEKEAIAVEAKQYGPTHVAETRNIALQVTL